MYKEQAVREPSLLRLREIAKGLGLDVEETELQEYQSMSSKFPLIYHLRSLSIRLELGESFQMQSTFILFSMISPPPHDTSLHCKLVPVHYQAFECGL